MPRTKIFQTVFLTSISVIALAGCGASERVDVNKTATPMPPASDMNAAALSATPQPLAPSDTLTPVMLTAVAPATDAVVPSSVETRMAKLEETVNSLRSDYNRIMPAFASLNTTNERIQTLLDEIEKETKPAIEKAAAANTPVQSTEFVEAPIIAPATTAVVVEEKKEEPKKLVAVAATEKPAAIASGGNAITGVRIGEHGTKTRIVLDLNSKTKPEFKYDLDNGEKILLVDLPTSEATGAQTGKSKSALIEGWNIQKGANGGSTVAIQLKKEARVLSTEFLKAEGKDPARLVMDIATGS